MASLVKGPSGVYNVYFRWQGRQHMKSTKTHDKREARAIQGKVDDTLNLLRTGRIPNPEPPPGISIGDWILSGCTATTIPESITLEAASKAYRAETLNKADNTRKGEALHLRQLCRIVGGDVRLDRIDLGVIKRYVKRRMSEPTEAKGRVHPPASGATVHKELLTFNQLWAWARQAHYVKGESPVKKVDNPRKWAITLPKSAEREPFMTWDQIVAEIDRREVPEAEQGALWAGLFLDEKQVSELLAFVQSEPPYPFMVPAFLLAADAGLRRSEIMRAQVADVRLDANCIIVREKKRVKSLSATTRNVPLTTRLKTCLAGLQSSGAYLVVDANGKPLTTDNATYYFERTLAGSKWAVIPGYHTLRHSYASICRRKKIPADVTAKWMGHTTAEMVALYQKMFPEDEAEYVKLLD